MAGVLVGWRAGEYALDNRAAIRLAGDDRSDSRFRRLEGFFAEVEPHVRHAGALVGSVAAEAGIGHNWPDIAIEANLGAGRHSGEQGEYQGEEESHCDVILLCSCFRESRILAARGCVGGFEADGAVPSF